MARSQNSDWARCGAPNSHPVLAVLLPLLYLREKSHPAWLGMLPIFFLITPRYQSGSFRVTHEPLQHPQIRVGRTASEAEKKETRASGSNSGGQAAPKIAPNWLSCHAAAFRAHVPSSRRV